MLTKPRVPYIYIANITFFLVKRYVLEYGKGGYNLIVRFNEQVNGKSSDCAVVVSNPISDQSWENIAY